MKIRKKYHDTNFKKNCTNSIIRKKIVINANYRSRRITSTKTGKISKRRYAYPATLSLCINPSQLVPSLYSKKISFPISPFLLFTNDES